MAVEASLVTRIGFDQRVDKGMMGLRTVRYARETKSEVALTRLVSVVMIELYHRKLRSFRNVFLNFRDGFWR